MIDRQWLGDVGLAVLVVLPTAALMWPSPTVSPPAALPHLQQPAKAKVAAQSQIDQRFGLHR
jgi:hypothetical protein